MALEIPETTFPRVIVIGGGFGGIQVAKKLRNKTKFRKKKLFYKGIEFLPQTQIF